MNTNKKLKVVTITLNPALDLTGSLDILSAGAVNLVNTGSLHPAGKGVNVAKVLADLGADVTVTGFLGRDNEALFCQHFKQMGAQDEFIRIDGATRINVKLVEDNGRVSDINFPGISVSKEAIEQFESRLFELATTHDFFVLAGSLATGISPELCASWIEKLHTMGKKVFFDSSRAALVAGVNSHPWLIKPNDDELSELVGRPLESLQEFQQVAHDLANKGIENVVISLGSKGVMWLGKDNHEDAQWIYSQPPKMNVVSTVGAGDTLVAGLCWGQMQTNWSRTQILSFATALSALAVSQVGVGVTNIEDVTRLQQQVTLNVPANA
jgi:1-phosphofructokinase